MWKCSECQTENADTISKCSKCGHQTISFAMPSDTNKSPSNNDEQNIDSSSQKAESLLLENTSPLNKYSYKAKSENGQSVKGEILASSEIDLSNKLAEKGLYLIGIAKVSQNLDTPNNSSVALGNNTKKCPYCAETIKKEAKICRFCKMNLEPTEASLHPTIASNFNTSKSTAQRKNISSENLLYIIIILAAISFVATSFSSSNNSTVEPSHTDYPELGALIKLKSGYAYGASLDLHKRIRNILASKDNDALLQILSTGLAGVTQKGDEAYYEGIVEGDGWLPSGMVKIRFKGSLETYYTNGEAVGIKY